MKNQVTVVLTLLLLMLSSPLAWAAPDSGAAVVDAAAAVTVVVPALPLAGTDTDVAGAVGAAVKAAQSGQWWYMSAVILMVLMFLLKKFKLLAKLGRWKYIILPVLSLGAAVLAKVQGGVDIPGMVSVFTSSWATGMLQEAYEHGIRGKTHGEAPAAPAEPPPAPEEEA